MKKILVIAAIALAGAAGAYWWFVKRDKTEQLALIPKDAVMVFGFNTQSIYDKLDWKRVKELKMVKELMKSMNSEEDKFAFHLMEDPLSSGIDIAAEPYIYVSNNSMKGQEIGITFRLFDNAKFTELVEKQTKMKHKVLDDAKGLKAIQIDETTILAWDDDKSVFLKETKKRPEYKMNEDGTYTFEEPEAVKMDMTKRVKDIFSMTQDASILANSDFNSIRKETHDVNMYINYEHYMQLIGGLASSVNITKDLTALYKDMSMGGTVVFENDKIAGHSKIYFASDAAREAMMMGPKQGLSEEHLKQITNKTVFALLTTSLDLTKVFNNINKMKTYSDALEKVASSLGLTLTELENLLSGQMSFALTDIKSISRQKVVYDYNVETEHEEEMIKTVSEPMPIMTLALGLKDKKKFAQIMEKMMIVPQGGIYTFPISSSLKMYIAENSFGITASNDSNLIMNVVSKKFVGEMPQGPARDLAKEKNICFYISMEIDKYPEALKQMMKDGGFYIPFQSFMKEFKDIQMSGEVDRADMYVNMTEGDGSNSLYRIFAAIDRTQTR